MNFLIIKPTRSTNFSNLFLEWNSTCFGQFFCPSSGVFHCTQQWYMSYRFADSCRAGSGWNPDPARQLSYRFADSCRVGSGWNPDPARHLSANLYDIYHCCIQWKTDDGQRNCPKHVEFHSKNKFEKLVHVVGFIIRKFITMHGHMNIKQTNEISVFVPTYWLTLRLLMSYIYGAPILDVSRSYTTTHHSR